MSNQVHGFARLVSIQPFGTALRILKASVAVVIFSFAVQARATTVGCSGAPAGTYDFPTLSAAIGGAPISNNTITIYGTCTDDVVINGAQNLTITGAPGAALIDAANGPSGAVLEIDNSQNVTLQNLRIQLASYGFYGPFPGIAVTGSTMLIEQVNIEGNTGTDGIDINPMSSVQLLGANTIEDNNDGQGNGEGISLAGPAANVIIGGGPGAPTGCTVIQGNGDAGILATNQAAVTIIGHPSRCVTIQNNTGGFGLQVSGSSTAFVANRYTAAVITLSGNLGGAAATAYGHLTLNGPMLIENNSVAGVWLRDASVNMNGSAASPNGPVIQQNGGNTSFGCCLIPGGVSAQGNSNLFLNAALVTNNVVPGINVQDASTAILNAAGPISVTQNPIGISVLNASTVSLYAAPSITGNANGDLVCGAFSVAYGDASQVGKMRCNSFTPQNTGQGNGPHGKLR